MGIRIERRPPLAPEKTQCLCGVRGRAGRKAAKGRGPWWPGPRGDERMVRQMATLAEMAAKVAEGKANGAKVRAARAARPVVHASTCEAPVATVWRVCAAVLAQDEGA